MSKVIWKKELESTDVQIVLLPDGAEILCAKKQHNMVCIWFLCDPDAPAKQRQISMIGTGEQAPQNCRYIDTVLFEKGKFVVHVFEYPE